MKFYPYLLPFVCFGFLCSGEAERLTLPLWPELAPGEVAGEVGPEGEKPPKPGEQGILRITNVSTPTLTVYPADPQKSNGAAVLVCPGGGYGILAYEHEGTDVCKWLNKLGITGILLKYRVPRRKDRAKHEAPLQDSQRALGLVRKHAKDWGINPSKLGILGFSAGGHLSLMTLTSFNPGLTHEWMMRTICPADRILEFWSTLLPGGPNIRMLFPEVVIMRCRPVSLFIRERSCPCGGSAGLSGFGKSRSG